MASPATSLHDLPAWLDTAEVAAVLRLDTYTVRRNLREGVIPGAIKLPGRLWRVPRESIEAILADQKTPAAQRAELLGDDTITFLRELAEAAPPLTDAQKDIIRAAFRGA
jgi:excisionase family DNA binding protein